MQNLAEDLTATAGDLATLYEVVMDEMKGRGIGGQPINDYLRRVKELSEANRTVEAMRSIIKYRQREEEDIDQRLEDARKEPIPPFEANQTKRGGAQEGQETGARRRLDMGQSQERSQFQERYQAVLEAQRMRHDQGQSTNQYDLSLIHI